MTLLAAIGMCALIFGLLWAVNKYWTGPRKDATEDGWYY